MLPEPALGTNSTLSKVDQPRGQGSEARAARAARGSQSCYRRFCLEPPILGRWQKSPGVSRGPGKVSGDEVYVTSDSSSALAHPEVEVPHPTSPGTPNRAPEFRGDRMVPNTFSHPI